MEAYKNKLQNIISTHFDITKTSKQGLREAAQLVEDVADSFGGCIRCWGRGYIISMGPDSSTLCDCHRGEQLRVFGDVMFQKDA